MSACAIQAEEWDKCTKSKKWGGKKSEYYNWKEELPLSLHLDQYKEHFSTDKNPENARGKGRTAAIFSAGSWGILTHCKLMHAIQRDNQQSHYTGIIQPYRIPCCMGRTLYKNNLHRDIYNYSNGNPFNRSILQTEVSQISSPFLFTLQDWIQCGKKIKKWNIRSVTVMSCLSGPLDGNINFRHQF